MAFAVGSFVALTAIPIAAKWLLIGSWKEEAIPIWSLRYFRFWVVKTLVRSAPMALFAGSPIYNVYLRLLGAKIGRNTVIQSQARSGLHRSDLDRRQHDPAEGRDLLGYKAQSNYIHTGPITIGDNAYVGEASVLDIDTAMGDDTQLGHASSLQSGQRVPDGKHYHGSPAQETHGRLLPGRGEGVHAAAALALSGLPARRRLRGLRCRSRSCCCITCYPYLYRIHRRDRCSTARRRSRRCSCCRSRCCWCRSCCFVGVLAIRLAERRRRAAAASTCFLQEDKTYVLYGFHYFVHRIVSALSNSRRSTTSCSATAPPSSTT